MATSSILSAICQEEINYTRMQMIIQKVCHKVMTEFLLRKIKHVAPVLSLDNFLATIRTVITQGREGRLYEMHYFPLDANKQPLPTNLQDWDIQMLSFILTRFCNMSPAEKDDIKFIREKRNYLSHMGKPEVADIIFTTFKSDLQGILKRVFGYLQDTKLEEEIKGDLDAVDNRLSEHLVIAYKTIHRQNFVLEEVQRLQLEHSEKLDTIIDGIRETQSCLADDAKKRLKPPECAAGKLIVEKCGSPQEEERITDAIVQNFESNGVIESIKSNLQSVFEKFKDAYGQVTSLRRGCVEFLIKFNTLQSCLSYIEDVVAGNLDTILKPLQDAVRQEFENDKIELRFIMTEDQFDECITTVRLGLQNALLDSFSLKRSVYNSQSGHWKERSDSPDETTLSNPNPTVYESHQQKPGVHDSLDMATVGEADAKAKDDFCEPCLNAGNKDVIAKQYCEQCDEYLCNQCTASHKTIKATRLHGPISIQDKKTRNTKLCEPCGHAGKTDCVAYNYCEKCEEYLCTKCTLTHSFIKATKSHKPIPISQMNCSDKVGMKCKPCEQNGLDVFATKYCKECEELLCQKCTETHKTIKAKKLHHPIDVTSAKMNANINHHEGTKESSNREEDNATRNVAPGIPTATEIGADYVKLTWDSSSNFKQGDYYQVWYKDMSGTGKWKTYNYEFETAYANLRDIKANTRFVYRVRVVTEDGEGPYSPESEEIATKPSPASRILSWGKKLSISDTSPQKFLIPATEIEYTRNTKAKTRKFDVGTPPPAPSEKTIMLIGATGTGKSTLVDGIVNYVLGVNWDDNFRFTIVDLEEEEKSREEDQALSQTEWITCYAIHPQDGSRLKYTLNIIDTPGFGDTRGLKRDQDIVEQIRQLFTENGPKGVATIDAVCFLIKAPDARLTAVQSYIFQQVMSLFGKDIANNICSLITFADGNSPPVLAALKSSGLPFGKSFTFNNSGLFAENDVDSSNLSPIFWEMGVKSLRAFFNHLDTVETKSLRLTKTVLDDRFNLESTVRNLQPTVDAGLKKINALKQEIKIFQDNEDIIKDNKDFEYTVTTVQQKRQELPRGQHVTNCTHCHWTCHESCGYANDDEKRHCIAMDERGYCRVCPDKCYWQKHANTPYIFKYFDVTEKKTYAEKLKKYQAAEGKKLSQEQIFEKMAEELDDMVDAIEEMMHVVKQCNERLAEIALRPNPLSMTDHIDLMIENEKMQNKTGFMERINTLNEFKKRAQVSTEVERFHKEAKTTLDVVSKNKGQKEAQDVKLSWQRFKGFFGSS